MIDRALDCHISHMYCRILCASYRTYCVCIRRPAAEVHRRSCAGTAGHSLAATAGAGAAAVTSSTAAVRILIAARLSSTMLNSEQARS